MTARELAALLALARLNIALAGRVKRAEAAEARARGANDWTLRGLQELGRLTNEELGPALRALAALGRASRAETLRALRELDS